MTTYILKCSPDYNDTWFDSLFGDDTFRGEYRGFAVGGHYKNDWKASDNELSRVLFYLDRFSGCASDVEWFMLSCGVKINGNRTQFYKALTASRDDSENACNVLNLIFGGSWKYTTLHGCCQGDWCDCIYNADIVKEDTLSYIEAVYFNTGYELGIIEDSDKAPAEIDFSDVDYWDYTDKWSDDDIKAWCDLPKAVVLEDHESTVIVHSFY